jgi:lysophospholipase L1-like esterase
VIRHRAVAVLSLIAIATPGVPSGTRASRPPEPPISWLSTGDSFASGEGIAGTGVGTDYCAQSRLAFGPKAADLLREQRQWSITLEAFSACTGHRVGDFFNSRPATPDTPSIFEWSLEQAAPPDQRWDVITFSFGGNDVGFDDVLIDCLVLPDTWPDVIREGATGDRCDVSERTLRRRIDDMVAGKPYSTDGSATNYGTNNQLMSLSDFYVLLAERHLTDRGVLVIAGYPRLLAPSDDWSPWRGNRCNLITATDADTLGRVAEHFDAALDEAAADAQARTTRTIVYVSRLQLFDDGGDWHSLCALTTQWVNGVTIGFWDGSLRPQHSFHPNELGHTATAEEIAQRLDELLAVPDPPPDSIAAPESSPPIDAGPSFEKGDAFDDVCAVAWPTAPLYTADSIQMRMSCQRTPSQFTFVDVIYGDPDLPITPSTGYVSVRGVVAGVAESGLGFRILLVEASAVDL